MPQEAAFRCSVIRELHRQLGWSSRDAARRLLDEAERLVRELDLTRAYPSDFIEWRLTHWRRDDPDPGAVVPGEVLLADLVILGQRVSRRCPVSAQGRNDLLMVPEVAAALGISVRTLVRRRRQGIFMRYVICDDGEMRLACTRDVLDWYLEQHPSVEEAKVLGSSAELIAAAHRSGAEGLTKVARDLADEFPGRSIESIRGVLRRAVRRGEVHIQPQRRLGSFERRFAVRAARRGLPPTRIAKHLGITQPSLYRSLASERRRRVGNIHASFEEFAPHPDGGQALLSDPAVSTGLPAWSHAMDFIHADDPSAPPTSIDLMAMALLRHRSMNSDLQTAAGLDRAETDLRWHVRLCWRLMSTLQPMLRQAVTLWANCPAERLPTELQWNLLTRTVPAIRGVVLRASHEDAPRLQSRTHAAVDRVLAGFPVLRQDLEPSDDVVAARLVLAGADPWGDLLPDPIWIPRIDRLPSRQQHLMTLKWGIPNHAPRTATEIAEADGIDVRALARSMSTAQRTVAARS